MHPKRNHSSTSQRLVRQDRQNSRCATEKVAKRARGTFEIEEAWGQKQRGHEAIINRAMSFGPQRFFQSKRSLSCQTIYSRCRIKKVKNFAFKLPVGAMY